MCVVVRVGEEDFSFALVGDGDAGDAKVGLSRFNARYKLGEVLLCHLNSTHRNGGHIGECSVDRKSA